MGLTRDTDRFALGVNVSTFTLVKSNVTALVLGDKANGLHDGSKLDCSDSAAGKQRREQEVVTGRDNHLESNQWYGRRVSKN